MTDKKNLNKLTREFLLLLHKKLSAEEMYLKFLARFSYLEERNVGKRLLVTESTLTEANGKKYRNMNVKRNSCEEEQASSTAPLQQHFLFKIETHLSGVV